MKKKMLLLFAAVVVVFGVFYTMDKMTYTSFQEIAINQLKQGDAINIEIKRYSDDARISITDKNNTDKILKAFAGMELKKVSDTKPSGAYAFRIYVNNLEKVGMEVLQDKNYVWITQNNKGEIYKIVNDFDPIKTIEHENLNWKSPN